VYELLDLDMKPVNIAYVEYIPRYVLWQGWVTRTVGDWTSYLIVIGFLFALFICWLQICIKVIVSVLML
jgi:hypothetical protein